MRIGIVGAGLMGLSVARSLLSGGHQVIVLDQAEVPNFNGASVDRHRLIRYTYGPSRAYTRMVREAYRAWARLWDDLGASFYRRTGTLVIGDLSDPWVRETEDVLKTESVSFDRVGPDLALRYPMLQASLGDGLFVSEGGVLLADEIVESLRDLVVRGGASLRTTTRVVGIDPKVGEVCLEDGDSVQADIIVVAAGAWIGALMPEFKDRAVPSRQICVLLEPPADVREAWSAAPMMINLDASDGFYAVPPVAGTPLKIGDHRFSMSGNPDQPQPIGQEAIDAIVERLHGRISDPESYDITGALSCFYTVADGERFIVQKRDRAWVLTGFSGHGFKFGPLIGERVAEAIAGTRSAEDVASWAAGRGPV